MEYATPEKPLSSEDYTVEIEIEDTGIPNGVMQIAQQLPDRSDVSPGQSITLKFSGDSFVLLTGLALLAAWRKSLPPGVIVSVDDSQCSPDTQKFLSNTGFREIVDTGHETPSTQTRIDRVPLQPITNQFTTEATVNRIVSMFDEYASRVDKPSPFRTMISELCENCLAHSHFVSPGYACARVMEQTMYAEIAIADTGVGIRQSYLSGTNESVIQRINKGASPLELAIDGLNSSKPRPVVSGTTLKSYFGFGLLVTRRLIEENGGRLLLMSGDEALSVHGGKQVKHSLSRSYPGTFIGIVPNLNYPLPLDKIYEEFVAAYTGHEPSKTRDTQSHAISPRKEQHEIQGVVDTAGMDEQDTTVIQQKKIELRHYGTELLTRDAGTAIRADIATWVAAGYRVQVSLNEVSDITPSVADEAFAKLAQILGNEIFQEKVEIVDGTPLANRLVNFVLKTRQNRSI